MTLPVCRQPTGREFGEGEGPGGIGLSREAGAQEGTLQRDEKSGRGTGEPPTSHPGSLTSTPVLPP